MAVSVRAVPKEVWSVTDGVDNLGRIHVRKAVRCSEQIMSADKYPSIFSRQMEAIVYIFFARNGGYCLYNLN